MNNFTKFSSKTVASVYTTQTTGMRSIPEHHVNRGIGKTLGKVYQTKGYGLATIPLYRIKRGVAL